MPEILANTEMPALEPDAEAGAMDAVFHGVVAVPLRETGWIRVTGEDRARWLNGMVTNAIQGLGTGEGCYNFLLNAQGRIQGTAWAFAEPDALLLETDRQQVPGMLALLDRFIIMDDVALVEETDGLAGLLVAGPQAGAMLKHGGLVLSESAEATASLREFAWNGGSLRVLHKPGRLFPRWEIWAEPELLAKLAAGLAEAGAVSGEPTVIEWMRLLEGTPRFGVDIRERELPQETGQTEALHFSKGCYLGQEIVERIRSRGNVHRTFHGFLLEGAEPAPGTVLEAAGKPVGELTSVAALPTLPGYPAGLLLGLGYLRWETLELRHDVIFAGGRALPIALPIPVAAGAHPIADAT